MRRLLWLLGVAVILSGCTAAQVQRNVVAGQLFCAKATADGPLVMAIADATSAPVVVTGLASASVASICAEVGAIPVTPPPMPAAAPVVVVPLPAAVP